MNIGELCNREVMTIERGASVVTAARLMRKAHVGSLVVTEADGDDNRPVGVLTDRDLVVEILAAEVDPQSVRVGDVMSDKLVTVAEKSGLFETVELMRQRGVRRIPVIDEQRHLVGLLAADDALEAVAEQLSDLAKLPHWQQRKEQAMRR